MLAAAAVSSELSSAGIAILVALVGYVLHRKSNHIEVKVNGQMTMLLARISQLEEKMSAHGVTVPAAIPPAELLANATAAQELGKLTNGGTT